jgi:hypothetical protein
LRLVDRRLKERRQAERGRGGAEPFEQAPRLTREALDVVGRLLGGTADAVLPAKNDLNDLLEHGSASTDDGRETGVRERAGSRASIARVRGRLFFVPRVFRGRAGRERELERAGHREPLGRQDGMHPAPREVQRIGSPFENVVEAIFV